MVMPKYANPQQMNLSKPVWAKNPSGYDTIPCRDTNTCKDGLFPKVKCQSESAVCFCVVRVT